MPPSSSVWPVVVETVRPVSAGAMAWRCGDRWSLSVAVKATFALIEEGVCELVGPVPLARHERFAQAAVAGTAPAIVEDTDVVPYRPQVDVTFSGSVHAPHPVQALRARLAVIGPSDGIDKSVQAVGDRVGHAAPRPFRQMPLGWERAWAGADNPAGVKPGTAQQPNVLDPRNGDLPIGLGPIPRSWPSRARFVGSMDPRLLDGPVPSVPQSFAWEFYQGSPRDQRLGRLSGSETIMLENLLEGRPRLRTRLPGPRGRARLHAPWTSPEGQMLDLAADALIIDGETQSLSIVWRASVPLPHGERSLDGARVVTGVELPGFPMPWSGSSVSGTHAAVVPPAAASGVGQQLQRPPSLANAQSAGRPPPPPPPPPAPSSLGLPRAYSDDGPAEGTELLDTYASAGPSIKLAGAAAMPAAMSGPAPAPTSNSTMALTPEEAMRLIASAPRHMPFPGAGPPPPPPPPPSQAVAIPPAVSRIPATTMPSRVEPAVAAPRQTDSPTRPIPIAQAFQAPPPVEERTRQIELKSVFAAEETTTAEPESGMTRPHQARPARPTTGSPMSAGALSGGPTSGPTSASTMALTPEQAQAMIAAAAAQRGAPPTFGAPPPAPPPPPSALPALPGPPPPMPSHGGFPAPPPRVAPPPMVKQDTLPSTAAADGDVDASGATFALTPEQAQQMIEDAKRRQR